MINQVLFIFSLRSAGASEAFVFWVFCDALPVRIFSIWARTRSMNSSDKNRTRMDTLLMNLITIKLHKAASSCRRSWHPKQPKTSPNISPTSRNCSAWQLSFLVIGGSNGRSCTPLRGKMACSMGVPSCRCRLAMTVMQVSMQDCAGQMYLYRIYYFLYPKCT